MHDKTKISERKVYEILRKNIPKEHFDKLFYLSNSLTHEILIDEVILKLLHTDRKPKLPELKAIKKLNILWKK